MYKEGSYNGWTNIETWNTKLHMDNIFGLYKIVLLLYKSSKKGKRNSLEFIKWLQQSKDAKELTMTLFESESEYRKRLIEFMKHLPVYARKHNIKNFYDDHDWSVEQGF